MSCHGLKMAYRNLLKYKLQSVICVLGLAGGLSCFTVCNYMLREELAWNKQLPHYEDTYKLVTIRENGEVDGWVSLITLRPDVFAAIFILMMIIMLLTIGSQLLKIIRVNPTEVLKND